MPDRFFVPELSAASDRGTLSLTGSEAHHLLHVLRAKVGLAVELFDGAGCVAAAEVTRVGKRDLELIVQSPGKEPRDRLHLELAVAPPKGDRLRWLVEKATEVGVSGLTLIDTERGQGSPVGGKLQKLEQTMLAACKQSRRAWAMSIQGGVPLASLLTTSNDFDARLLAHPESPPLRHWLQDSSDLSAGRVLLIVGPEGGFTDDEVATARQSGVTAVGVGGHILRVETAAIALAAAVRWMLPTAQQTAAPDRQ